MAEMTCDKIKGRIERLKDEIDGLLMTERSNAVYSYNAEHTVAIKSIPVYNFNDTQSRIDRYQKEIIALQHVINAFNATTKLYDAGDITIDEALLELEMLEKNKAKLKR